MFKKINKTKVSLALSAALLTGAFTGQAQAVNLTHEGLGDAAVFQYYSARDNWQTFFRLINTSGDALAVKLRFREAANSREVLDFTLFLSPYDEWTAWSTENAVNGNPGIRTNDTSCILEGVGTNNLPGNGFKSINPAANLIGAEFSDAAFKEGSVYDDKGIPVDADRLREGYLTVISTAQISTNSQDNNAFSFATNVTHTADTGKPFNCAGAAVNYSNLARFQQRNDYDANNVLAANAYMVNIQSGQGAGYDPLMLANFSTQDFILGSVLTDGIPNLDSGTPYSAKIHRGRAISAFWNNPMAPTNDTAFNQERWDGTTPAPVGATWSMDLDGSGVATDQVFWDLDNNGNCSTDVPFNEADTPAPSVLFPGSAPATYNVYSITGAGICLTDTPTAFPVANSSPVIAMVQAQPPRVNQFAFNNRIRGGVDAVSALLMRNNVINEWAAFENTTPNAVIKDYFTQWVLTFPTKHFYVDLMDDPITAGVGGGDDFAPTMSDPVDPDAAGFDKNDAFAPFSQEFDSNEDKLAGQSCEYFDTEMYNTEERFARYTSPQQQYPDALCYEVNVVNFNERYTNRGLASKFSVTVPQEAFPTDAVTLEKSKLGWARLSFVSRGALVEGLTPYRIGFASIVPSNGQVDSATIPNSGIETANSPGPDNDLRYFYTGLPVDGFMLSVYDTGDSKNHTMINKHKHGRFNFNRFFLTL